jgi:GAF domain-containing protein
VSGNTQQTIEAVRATLQNQTTVPSLLAATARALVERLSAEACTISRVIGDLLVDLVDYNPSGHPVQIGHGYLVSDFPLTLEVLDRLESRAVFLGDPDADEKEAELLRDIGFDSLLMVPIEAGSRPWGLAEVYGKDLRFGETETRLAEQVAEEAGAAIARLERPA